MDENLDDYDFTPTANSNLAALFGITERGDLENVDLRYTPPKQPKQTSTPDQKPQDKKLESNIICAIVVTVWKLTNGKYESAGKLGFAIIGCESLNSYDLIIYKTKTNVITKTNISSDFEIVSTKDNFASFYDNLKQNWLIKFKNNNEHSQILKLIDKYGGKVVFKAEEELHKKETAKEKHKNENIIIEKESCTTLAGDIADNRANILNRIAKLGQSILPGAEGKTEYLEGGISKVEPSTSVSLPVLQTSSHYITPQASTSSSLANHAQIPNSVSTFIAGTPLTYDPVGLMFNETRSVNSELRLNLNHISDKINQVLKLVEPKKPESNPNEEVLKSKIKALQLKVYNLSQELQGNVEQYAELQLKCKTLDSAVQLAEERLKSIPPKVETTNKESQTMTDEGTQTKGVKFQEHKTNIFTSKLKQTLSDMYNNLQESFEDDRQYSSSEIGPIVAQHMKNVTRKIIHHFQELDDINNL